MSMPIHLAFDREALFSKSQLYMARAYRAETDGNEDEYQLWASLALEILAKSTLSAFHPALVADPTHYQSLFAACKVSKQVDVKTISASTLYKRLGHLSKAFDERVKNFCEQLSFRRNVELHSGEAPFVGMQVSTWENAFWHTAYILLEMQEKELSDWLQPDKADSRKQFLHDSAVALKKAVDARVANAKNDFLKKIPAPEDRKVALEQSKAVLPSSLGERLLVDVDKVASYPCPSCSGAAIVGGDGYDETVISTEYGDGYEPPTELVETTYAIEELFCPLCELRLKGVREIEASGIDEYFRDVDAREMEYEPDYGND